MLYLHGLSALGSVARCEAPPGFRLATYDQRGHGDATPLTDPADYGIEEFVADAIAVLDHLGWDSPAVGGSSMGAAVALKVALAHPDRVSSLVVGGPAFGDAPNAALIETFDPTADAIDSLGIEAVIPLVRRAQIARGLAEDATAFLENWRRHDSKAMAAVLRTVTRWVPFPNLEGDLRTIDVPVVVAGWPGDPFHPIALAERIASVTGGRLARIAGVEAVLADPGSVSRALAEVL